MLGSVVHLQTFGQTKRLGRFKSLIQGSVIMSVEIVTYKNNPLCIRIPFIKKPLDEVCPVYASPLFSGFCMTPAGEGLCEQEDTTRAIPNVFVVLITYARLAGCKAFSCLRQQLDRLFVHTDNRPPFIIRTAVHLKDILHRSNKSSAMAGWNTPALL